MFVRQVISVAATLLISLQGFCASGFYSVADGLSNEAVKTIYQDDSGFIWLGTKYGLNRFDGYEFKHYLVDIEGLSQKNDIVSMVPDGSGRLWIGTFDGVILFDQATNTYLSPSSSFVGELPSGVVVGTYVVSRDEVWVATKPGLYKYKDGVFKKQDLFGSRQIRAMGDAGDGYIVLDVEDEGIVSVNTRSLSVVGLGCNENNEIVITTVLYDEQDHGTWLFADTQNILRYDRLTGRVETVEVSAPGNSPESFNQVHNARRFSDNEILLATDNGIMLFNTHTHTVYPSPYHILDSHRVMSVHVDNEQNVWAGTFSSGVCLISSLERNIETLSIDDCPGKDVIYVGEAGGKRIIGMKDSILLQDLRGGKVRCFSVESFPGIGKGQNEIYYVTKLRSEEIFVYVLNQGCFVLDLRKERVYNISLDVPPTSQIRFVCEDANGKIWIAAEDLLIASLDTKEVDDNLSTNELGYTRYMLTQSLCLENNGNMFVGTRNNGLWQYVYDRYGKAYSDAIRFGEGLPQDANVVALYVDNNENVWVGTYNYGLYVFNASGEPIASFNKDNGFSDNMVCSIVEDSSNRVWVSTSGSVAMVSLKSSEVIRYSRHNGYPLSRNSIASMCLGEDGKIYVGGDGIAVFDPIVLGKRDNGAQSVIITCLETLDTRPVSYDSVQLDKEIRLKYPCNSATVKVSNLIYLHQSACSYAYKLSGDSMDWRIIGGNEIVLSHMGYGRHVLSVKCTDEYGIWSDKITELTVYVVPPLWATFYAKVFYAIATLLLAALLIGLFLRSKKAEYKHMLDRAEQENIEKAYQERMNLFTQFSHELRTPLTLIKSPVEDMLSDGDLPEKYKFTVNQVSRNANKMLMLVNQLLDFRRLEHDSLKLKLTRTDCNAFLSDQLSGFREMASKKNIELRLECEFSPDNLWLDKDLFERVIVNLLSNAVKNTPVGGKIILGSHKGEAPDVIVIYVRDNGIGIPADKLPRIFEPFYQVSRGVTGSFGSGIGLTLVKNVVSLHNGKVWVESQEHVGSTFFVELPLGEEAHDEDPIIMGNEFIQESETIDVPTQTKVEDAPLLLVVEDDDEMRQYIASRLSSRFRVELANDGETAVRMANELMPDLIVSDVMMPNMDGIAFCTAIKTSVTTAHIPVILLTAKDQTESIEEGYSVLADDYILKPFNSKILLAKCDSIISNRKILRQRFQQNLELAAGQEAQESGDPFIDRIVELVKENLDSPDLTISYLYTHLGMSRAQFFKKVKAVSDLSPNKIIINVKMGIAAQMLKRKDMNISEVAYSTGFADPSYFSRVFKSVYQVTPREFKSDYE